MPRGKMNKHVKQRLAEIRKDHVNVPWAELRNRPEECKAAVERRRNKYNISIKNFAELAGVSSGVVKSLTNGHFLSAEMLYYLNEVLDQTKRDPHRRHYWLRVFPDGTAVSVPERIQIGKGWSWNGGRKYLKRVPSPPT